MRVPAVLLIAACTAGGQEVAAPPSDENFLAARADAEARILTLFETHHWRIAPHPEAAGSPTKAGFVGDSPDPREFATAGKVVLPLPTTKLTSCHVETTAALAAFAAIEGAAYGEGKMGSPHLTVDEAYQEVQRQADTIAAAYCRWRTASRVCHDETASIAVFDPPWLECG